MEDSASLQEFLTLFPWPKSFLEFDRNYFILNRYEVSASTKDIWALFSDTSKLNRSLKIPSADFTENHGGRCGASKYFGLSNNWLEPPWEWIQERVLICKKVFFNGPAKKLYCIFYIEPNKDKNRLWVYYGWERRNILGSFLLKRINNYLLNSYEKVLPHALKFLDQDSSSIQSPLLRNSQHASQEMINKFSSIKETLKKAGHEHKSLETFLDYLLYGDPQDLYRIRIKKLSLEWNIPLEKLLDLA